MTPRPPHVRGALPFLRSGPMWRLHSDAEPELDRFLADHPYVRIDLDGTRITSRSTLHEVLGEAFGFPDWYGNSWDAFHDCWYGFASEHENDLVAVVWHDLDRTAAAAPATAAELGWALMECADGHWPTPDPGPPTTMHLDLFVLGHGDDFDRPDPTHPA